MWNFIAEHIALVTGAPFTIEKTIPVGGGCINSGYRVTGEGLNYFVKLNDAVKSAMFAAESLALERIGNTNTVKVPRPICTGVAGNSCYLVLEWLDLADGNNSGWEAMGRKLAELHAKPVSDRYGWERDNTIGSTPQINPPSDNWAEFFALSRIGYQLRLAKSKGADFPEEKQIIARVKDRLKDRNPPPSIVHGDLWSGNAALTRSGEPVIFDPAPYWGDREVDLAMTELFGGFPPAFYRGYNAVFPLDDGYQHRKNLYNLYHVLNHFNLFGGGYERQARRILEEI